MTKPEKSDSIDVHYLANLARIELSDKESQELKSRLETIIKYLEKLNSVDVTNVEATAHTLPSYNVWEDDEPIIPFTPEQALMNAPKSKHNQVVVPKTVE